ncbi:AFG2-interacting ribosome maturation factor-like [Asterias amurensis]|uniref:AFG2-interacting ribosome maturation factor-like n=1 Tax=Asterias amurensis TaxID=7602 RepID=UPI003AB8AA5D
MSTVHKVTTEHGLEFVHKQLRKTFKMVKQQQLVWQDVTVESLSLVKSLTNLGEQLQCSRLAAQEGSSDVLQQFPDLQARLEFKLLQSAEVVMTRLKSCLETMEDVCHKHMQYGTYSLNAYHNHYREIGTVKVSTASATWPSIADMLQWVTDLSVLYRRTFAEKTWMFDTVSYDSLDEMSGLVKRWSKNDKELTTAVNSILSHVEFFMADG